MKKSIISGVLALTVFLGVGQIVTTPVAHADNISIIQLIRLFIALGIIPADKVAMVEAAFGMPNTTGTNKTASNIKTSLTTVTTTRTNTSSQPVVTTQSSVVTTQSVVTSPTVISQGFTTHYIDFNSGSDSNNGLSENTPWKRAPGMVGFSGFYNHNSGDHFIFKGGVTWPSSTLPLTIKYSGGGVGNEDAYTVDKSWYAGNIWARPIFDGQQALGANAYIIGDYIYEASNIIIDNLELINVGDPGTDSGTAIDFIGGSNIEIKNNILEPNGIEAFAYSTGNENANHIYIHDNYISEAGRGVVYGTTGYVLDNVRVYNNKWEGPGNLAAGVYHFDGLMVGNPSGTSCSKNNVATVKDIIFYNNLFYGDWSGGATAEYYSNGCTNNTSIYNNIFAIEDSMGSVNISPAFVFFGLNDGNISVYNNTFSSDSYPGKGAGAGAALEFISSYGSVSITKNIFSGFGIDILGDTTNTSSYSIDYNFHNVSLAHGYGELCWIGSNQMKSLSDCQTEGYEIHGLVGDPEFVAVPNGTTGSGNWQIQTTSSASGIGANLTNVFSQ